MAMIFSYPWEVKPEYFAHQQAELQRYSRESKM